MTTLPKTDFLEEYPAVLHLAADHLVSEPEYALNLLEPAARRILWERHRAIRDNSPNLESKILSAKLAVCYSPEPEHDQSELAHLLASAERLKEALLIVEEFLIKAPKDCDMLRFKASLLERLGSYQEAFAVIKQIGEIAPEADFVENDAQRIGLKHSKILAEEDKPLEALEAIRETININPSHNELHRFKSDVLKQLDRFGEAADALRTAIQLDGREDFEDKVQLVHLLEKAGRLQEALRGVEDLLERRPQDCDLLRFKASLLERSGFYKEAFKTIKQLRNLAPNMDYISRDFARIRKKLFLSRIPFLEIK